MTGVLIRERGGRFQTQTHWEEGHEKMEAESRVFAKAHQALLPAYRSRREA